MANYLELIGDKYVLTTSEEEEEEAKVIDVPADLYAGTLNEIESTNELISKLKKNPNK